MTIAMSAINTPVTAPPFVAYPFGVFSIVQATSPAEGHWRNGVMWQSLSCQENVSFTTDPCITTPDPTALAVNAVCPTIQLANPVTLYTYAKRSGEPLEEVQQLALETFTAAEQFAVEFYLWSLLDAAVPAPTVAPTAAVALARVERHLRQNYGGLGVIHMSPYDASLLDTHLEAKGTKLLTKLGTPVIVGGGYGTVDGDEGTIYGTGTVVMLREPGVNTDVAVYDKGTNDAYQVAQRTYVMGWDCTVVGATVTAPL